MPSVCELAFKESNEVPGGSSAGGGGGGKRKMSRRHRVELADKLKQKVGNSIGALQTICTHQKWPCPVYKQIGECGLPHQKEYAISVTVNCYSIFGVGLSKKEAKKNAASKMCDVLMPIVFRTKPIVGRSPACAAASSASAAAAAARHSHADEIELQFKNVDGACFKQLMTLDLTVDGFDYVAFLEQLRCEQSFITFYLSNDEVDGKFDEFTMFLFVGQQNTFAEKAADSQTAKMNVARKALQFLQLLQRCDSTSD